MDEIWNDGMAMAHPAAFKSGLHSLIFTFKGTIVNVVTTFMPIFLFATSYIQEAMYR